MTRTRYEVRKANRPLSECRQEERDQFTEMQTGLRRRHFQVAAERRAMTDCIANVSLVELKRLVAEGVLPGLKR